MWVLRGGHLVQPGDNLEGSKIKWCLNLFVKKAQVWVKWWTGDGVTNGIPRRRQQRVQRLTGMMRYGAFLQSVQTGWVEVWQGVGRAQVLEDLVSCKKEPVLSSHKTEGSSRGMKGTTIFYKGWLFKWGFHDKVTLSRELGVVKRGQANWTSRGDSSGNGDRYALRWHCTMGLSVTFSFPTRGKFLFFIPLPLPPSSLLLSFLLSLFNSACTFSSTYYVVAWVRWRGRSCSLQIQHLPSGGSQVGRRDRPSWTQPDDPKWVQKGLNKIEMREQTCVVREG